MNNEKATIFYSMKHQLKKSIYFFSLFNMIDLIVWSISILFGYILFTMVIIKSFSRITAILIISIMVMYYIILACLTLIPIEIFHNGLGLVICRIRNLFEKEILVWGGIDYGFESIQREEDSEKETKKAYRKRS